MKTTYDLASVALADLIVRAGERRAASDPKKDQEHDPDEEEDVEHRSLPVAPLLIHRALERRITNGDQKENEASHEQGASNDDEHEGEVQVEHSVLHLHCLHPENVPRDIRAHFLASNQAASGFLDGRASLCRNSADATRPLPHELWLTADGGSNGRLSSRRLVNVFGKGHHDPILSAPLQFCQASRLLLVVSVSLAIE